MSKILGIPAFLILLVSYAALAALSLIHSQLPLPTCVRRCQSCMSVAACAETDMVTCAYR